MRTLGELVSSPRVRTLVAIGVWRHPKHHLSLGTIETRYHGEVEHEGSLRVNVRARLIAEITVALEYDVNYDTRFYVDYLQIHFCRASGTKQRGNTI